MYERRFWPHGRRPPQYLRVWVDNYDEMGEATSYERVKPTKLEPEDLG